MMANTKLTLCLKEHSHLNFQMEHLAITISTITALMNPLICVLYKYRQLRNLDQSPLHTLGGSIVLISQIY